MAKDFCTQVTKAMAKEPSHLLNQPGFGHANENERELSDLELEKETLLSIYNQPSVYIQTKDASPFGKVFRNLLITELIKLDYIISKTPENSLVIDWTIDEVYHRSNRSASGVPGSKSAMILLGAGLYKIFDNSTAGALISTGIALDLADNYFSNIEAVSHNEIIISLSVSKNSFILAQQSGIYYVNDEDAWHYSKNEDAWHYYYDDYVWHDGKTYYRPEPEPEPKIQYKNFKVTDQQ